MGHVTYFWNFGTPSIFRERFELETSNLACILTTGGNNDNNEKLGQRGSGRGYVTYFCSIGSQILYIFETHGIGQTPSSLERYLVVLELVSSQNDDVDAARWKRTSASVSSTPPCGRTCSYEWDRKEEGKYYPLLHKTVNCQDTLYRMAHSPYTVVKPPPRRPPPELVQNYTIDGQCPISSYIYRDDSPTGQKLPRTHFNREMFQKLLGRDNVTNVNYYRDKNVLKPALIKYSHTIRDKRVAVIGAVKPWAEAMLLNLGANSVTTIEYSDLVIEHERLTTITPARMAKQFISNHAAPFDTVFTYSSLEHSGIGRYGDPIAPFGDLRGNSSSVVYGKTRRTFHTGCTSVHRSTEMFNRVELRAKIWSRRASAASDSQLACS